jgi:hypothetical protein
MPTLKGFSQSDVYFVTYWKEECKKKVRYPEKAFAAKARSALGKSHGTQAHLISLFLRSGTENSMYVHGCIDNLPGNLKTIKQRPFASPFRHRGTEVQGYW